MSLSNLYLISAQPDRCPDVEVANNLKYLVQQELSPRCPVSIQRQDKISFFDSGEGLEYVLCPHCNVNVDPDWWAEKMSEAAESSFENLEVQPMCCDRVTGLSELVYHQPAGFSRFAIIVERYEGDFLSRAEMRNFSHVVGFELRQVLARY